MTSKGFLMFAHNNSEIDYGKIALVNASAIKKNLKENKVAIVTDQGTLDWLIKDNGQEVVDKLFDHIIIIDHDEVKKNATPKKFNDTHHTNKTLMWYNATRSDAYDVTPFDETIMLDGDYIIQDNSLDLVWENDEEVLINKDARTILHKPMRESERRLSNTSIEMFWATLVYFKKSDKARLLFDTIKHVKDNYNYYRYVYEFPGRLLRNDYIFSIAIHMLSGFMANDEFKTFPQDYLLTSFDTDDIIEAGSNYIIFLSQDIHDKSRTVPVRVSNINVHIMNKYALLRFANNILKDNLND